MTILKPQPFDACAIVGVVVVEQEVQLAPVITEREFALRVCGNKLERPRPD
jgi:hypothetical protein